jgi:FSR family fosmidomycin resistance protein-like MFS transporter
MSVFSVGGGVGFGLSALMVTAVVAPLGLGGTPLLAVLPLLAAVSVALAARRLHARELERAAARPTAPAARPSEWWPFARLAFMYGWLSAIVAGVMAYVPLFLIDERGSGPGAANAMTTVFLVAGALGTLVGGRVADRFGRRVILVGPPLVLLPALAVLPSLDYAAMVPFIAVVGLLANACVSTAIVLAQEYLPGRLGLASGITVGASVGVGGIGAGLLGQLGDVAGPAAVLYVIAALPLAVIVMGASLPRPAALSPGSRWGVRAARS